MSGRGSAAEGRGIAADRRGSGAGGSMRRLYVRVLAMQILTLLALWLLQAAFGLGAG